MIEAPALLPVQTLRLQMQALASLGLNMQRVQAAVGVLPDGHDALVPRQQYEAMWASAQSEFAQPGLPSALAMAIPFGAFGALDYLVGSAATLGGCVTSAQLHFAMVASDVLLEIDAVEGEARILRVRAPADMATVALEFTLGSLFSRLRHLSGGTFKPLRVGLPLARSDNEPIREPLYGAALAFDWPSAEITMSKEDWNRSCVQADPFLHATLKQMAAQFHIGQANDAPLESAIRMRLRGALIQGDAAPARMARLLGVSERTLQRRLAELGRSFSEILEDFRREESARLLHDEAIQIVEVASRLGYAEQTSFTRAFRRWTGTTPAAWRAAHQDN